MSGRLMSGRFIETILAPIDFSENSLRGMAYGADLAIRLGARLHILHVVCVDRTSIGQLVRPFRSDPSGGLFEDARRRYDDLLPTLVGVDHVMAMRQGDPAEQILEYAERVRIDVIVIATRNLQGLTRVIKGSVTDELLRKGASCVLIVPAVPELVASGSSSERFWEASSGDRDAGTS